MKCPATLSKTQKPDLRVRHIYFILVLYNRKLGTGTQKPTNSPLLFSPYATNMTRHTQSQAAINTEYVCPPLCQCHHMLSLPIKPNLRNYEAYVTKGYKKYITTLYSTVSKRQKKLHNGRR